MKPSQKNFALAALGLSFTVWLFLPRPAAADFAGSPPQLTLTYLNSSTTIDSSLLSAWQQSPNQSGLFQTMATSLNSILNAFFLGGAAQNSLWSYRYSPVQVYDYVNSLAAGINKSPVEPVLIMSQGRVSNFTPPQNGQALNVYASTFGILQALANGSTTTPLVVNQVPPSRTLADTNTLGINQLIGEGVSNFAGSPHNRRVNIAVGIEKFQGVIIPQGATFSFDDTLGPVDGQHGFLPELVILSNSTVPEFGGGLCQVSTTTFRAAMAAGLPITDRRNHSYAVSYYSPQGTDATIYPGSADLKFVNDTPGAILIWPYESSTNTLVFDFYGTSDGRQVTLEKPVEYDRQSDGALKATWTRIVTTAAGVSRTDVFNSNYLPPALFHETTYTGSSTPASAVQ